MERGGGVVTPMTISFIKNNWSFKVFSGVVLIAVETLDRARSFVRRIRPTFDARLCIRTRAAKFEQLED